tara:strand:- start:1615 stop:2457 length:843 start_codon:yes stop_codon:yes gene_type:complete
MKLNYFLILFFIIFLVSCSKDLTKKSVINERSLNTQVLEAYTEGMKSLEEGDVLFAAKKFNEVEILYPQSQWAPKSSIMAAYAYYSQDYYDDAVAELERLIKVYPRFKHLDYAYYLLAISHYEQIVDEKKDLQSLINAKKNFDYVLNNYPESEYSLDASFKNNLINEILAAKQMYIGRYYFDKKKWIAAINRFRVIVDEYDTSVYTEEALHRLVEIYYIIGLLEESKKYANLLGYNYKSSQWYEKSYFIFNKEYEQNLKSIKKDRDKKNSIIKKFKSLFN